MTALAMSFHLPAGLITHLEDHLVRPVTLPQAEVGRKVASKQRLLLHGGQNRLVHLLLVLGAVAVHLLLGWLLTLSEETLLAALLVGLLVACKVVLAASLLHGLGVNAVERHGGLGGDHVAGIDAAERDTVELEWASNEENTLWEGLKEDHTLASEAASEEDEDGTRLERCARLVWAKSLAGL